MVAGQQQLDFVTLDVFSQTPYEGNPLAVVLIPPGRDLPTDTLQTIAREFNLSETVFIYLNDDAAEPRWRIRIFTTASELPFAGHPTIGAAVHALGHLLLASGGGPPRAVKGTFTCDAGPIEVDFDASTGVAQASIPHNVHLHAQPVTLDDVYALQPALRAAGVKPLAMRTVSPVRGMNFICVELPDLETLAKLGTTGVATLPRLDDEWDVGFSGSLFYVRTGEGEGAIRTRMIEGLLEDPATGSASCGLGALICLEAKVGGEFCITQGVEMGRRSDIGVKVTLSDDKASVSRIDLKGTAVHVMQGKLTY
ncbi:Diaminopimelate epimerase-like protein [Polychaeton citri CBS 116435]|uniref:Diaminopimelate epimerase-like protein n=1 Tax=Polychaeton citri CBS 116435 TaxID=1314669 RepID=A0A9P4QGL6_9PEZI|nr:Diaminopimelate epimerase-like protein [Polychaeton citri CBS 116435]